MSLLQRMANTNSMPMDLSSDCDRIDIFEGVFELNNLPKYLDDEAFSFIVHIQNEHYIDHYIAIYVNYIDGKMIEYFDPQRQNITTQPVLCQWMKQYTDTYNLRMVDFPLRLTGNMRASALYVYYFICQRPLVSKMLHVFDYDMFLTPLMSPSDIITIDMKNYFYECNDKQIRRLLQNKHNMSVEDVHRYLKS